MHDIRTLKSEANRSAKWRGHSLYWSSTFCRDGRSYAFGVCRKCRSEAFITDRPRPNEIDISGEAVALNCQS